MGGYVVAAYVNNLRQAVSSPRLDKYLPAGGSDLEMAVNYFWNIALSEALFPGFAAMEVALRNTIHNALTATFNEQWFYIPGLLEPEQLREFSQARLSLYKHHGNTPSVGLIVAQLNFGFWTTLLSRKYHDSLWNANRAENLRRAFPHVPRRQFQRELIHKRYNDLRFLRNRVMHHEPIWNRPHLLSDHDGMLAAIKWISPPVHDSIIVFDTFPEVYREGRSQIERQLQRHLEPHQ
jgi:hypothetical protein